MVKRSAPIAGASWLVVGYALVACDGAASRRPDAGVGGADARGTGIDADVERGADGAAPTDVGLEATGTDAGAVADGGREVSLRGDGGAEPVPVRWFEDVTATAGPWFEREPVDGYATIPDRMAGGVCPIDVDGRAPIDLLFAVRGRGRDVHLWVGLEPMRWADETEARGLADVHDVWSCLAYDEDGDGDQDIVLAGYGTVRLYENERGRFVDATERLGLEGRIDPRDMYVGAAAGDVDGDGDLDLAVAGFLRFDPARVGERSCGRIPCAADVTAFDPIADLLLVRGPDGRYEERAAELAPEMRLLEPGLVVAISDLDEDFAPDLYVGNDLGFAYRDRPLVRGPDGVLRDASERIGLAYNHRGYGIDTMGWSTGDLDGDGRLDHVATSFETDATAVFLCGADGFCDDVGHLVGTAPLAHTFRWGIALVDLDLDGDLDLVEATGHYYAEPELRAAGYVGAFAQPGNLLRNEGDGRLRQVALTEDDGLRVARASRGLAVTDLDDDGRPDIVLAPAVGPPALLRNVVPPAGRPLSVRLRGRAPNTEAAGARVYVHTSSGSMQRERSIGEGYAGCFDARMFWGLPREGPIEVEVRWPSGRTSRHAVRADDRILELSEL
ncbi:MAG: FG-GAP-like repeat-containing protein [Myxococcota bacterium]|nr:FG-GAP-like repeat-containing protein [Myxococcota bacterium]